MVIKTWNSQNEHSSPFRLFLWEEGIHRSPQADDLPQVLARCLDDMPDLSYCVFIMFSALHPIPCSHAGIAE